MQIATDPLSLLFIGCFLFGLLYFVLAALLGNLGHGAGHHAGHGALHHVHIGGHGHVHSVAHAHVGTAHAGHGTAQHNAAGRGTTQASNQGAQDSILSVLSYVNPTSIVFFLFGFGFFGYVFHNASGLQFPLALTLTLAGAGGLLIAALLLWMLNRVFGTGEATTIQDVADRTGLLGKVNFTIQENALGEVMYISPGGLRKSTPARSVDGRRLERGQEVVIVSYQKGVAEVDTWEHFISQEENENSSPETSASNIDELAELRALLEEKDKTNTEIVLRKELPKE